LGDSPTLSVAPRFAVLLWRPASRSLMKNGPFEAAADCLVTFDHFHRCHRLPKRAGNWSLVEAGVPAAEGPRER